MDNKISEGNILITEFTGRPFYAYKENLSYDDQFKTYKECLDFIKKNNLEGYQPELGWKLGLGTYHSSWDSLMPVVEKIQWFGEGEKGKTGWTFGMLHFEFGRMGSIEWHCSILGHLDILFINSNGTHSYKELKVPHISIYNEKGIETVWLAVVEFIKWYNKSKV